MKTPRDVNDDFLLLANVFATECYAGLTHSGRPLDEHNKKITVRAREIFVANMGDHTIPGVVSPAVRCEATSRLQYATEYGGTHLNFIRDVFGHDIAYWVGMLSSSGNFNVDAMRLRSASPEVAAIQLAAMHVNAALAFDSEPKEALGWEPTAMAMMDALSAYEGWKEYRQEKEYIEFVMSTARDRKRRIVRFQVNPLNPVAKAQ
jgi:hypothetical protein